MFGYLRNGTKFDGGALKSWKIIRKLEKNWNGVRKQTVSNGFYRDDKAVVKIRFQFAAYVDFFKKNPYLRKKQNLPKIDDPKFPGKFWTISEMDILYTSFLSLGVAFTTVVFFLAAIQLYYVIKYVSNERIQTDLYYLILMCPVRLIFSVSYMGGYLHVAVDGNS